MAMREDTHEDTHTAGESGTSLTSRRDEECERGDRARRRTRPRAHGAFAVRRIRGSTAPERRASARAGSLHDRAVTEVCGEPNVREAEASH